MGHEKKAWLVHVFDSEYFAFWMGVKCLFRYQDRATHQYICYRMLQTRKEEVSEYFPQLFHLMLLEDGASPWNRPIFRLLYKVSLQERHFAQVLGMYALSLTDSFQSGDRRHVLCVEIAEIMALPKRENAPKRKQRNTKKITMYLRYLRMTHGTKVGRSPSTEKMLIQQKAFYMLPMCSPRRKERRGGSLESLLVAMLSGVASVFGTEHHAFLSDILETSDAYLLKKKYRTKTALRRSTQLLSETSKESEFISKINAISNSLILVQRPLREQTLSTELNLMNLYLPENICLPLMCRGGHRSLLRVSSSFCKVLDSAARAPFLLIFETAKEKDTVQEVFLSPSPHFTESSEEKRGGGGGRSEKETVLRTAIKILGGLKELDSNSHVDLDILAIKTRVMKKIYEMHAPLPPAQSRAKKHAEEWREVKSQIRESSPYKSLPEWKVQSVIVKTGSDMKQEQLATQILRVIRKIWEAEKTRISIQTYEVVITGRSSGLIETITGARSIHQIKKVMKERGKEQSLALYFDEEWEGGAEDAKEQFFRSLVGCSIVSYILQIKDRHNGNILIDSKGRMVHIDFGFVLGAHPGFYSVESAPFKFSVEYAEVVGPERMGKFREEFLRGFLALRKNMDHIVTLVESISLNNTIPMVTISAAEALRDRFEPGMTEEEFIEHTSGLVTKAMRNVFTGIYDSFQYYTQGYCR